MEHRRLGRTGLAVSRLALGTWTCGAETDDDDAAGRSRPSSMPVARSSRQLTSMQVARASESSASADLASRIGVERRGS
jgi:hypothetical protein